LVLSTSDINTICSYHNQLRAAYGLPPVTWDSNLANQAGTYSSGCVFKHSNPGNSVYGENLAVFGQSATPSTFPMVSWKSQLDGWKAEETTWTCKTNICNNGSQCGHLTAMIWNGTTTVGCGASLCNPGTIYTSFYSQFMVCQYTPAGNSNGEHPIIAPLPPPCSTCPTLPTPSIIPSSGGPSPPTQPPVASPTAPLGSINPVGAPATGSVSPQGSPPAFPPATPGAPSWANCIGDYWPNGVEVLTPCNSAPKTFSGKLYCDVKDPSGYYWPVKNAGTSDCNFFASDTSDATASQDVGPLGLSTPVWIGIAVGIAVFIIIVIIVIIIIKKRSEDERV